VKIVVEQRAVIKFNFKLSTTATETYESMKLHTIMTSSKIFEWYKLSGTIQRPRIENKNHVHHMFDSQTIIRNLFPPETTVTSRFCFFECTETALQ